MKTGLIAMILLLPTFAAAQHETGSDLLRDCSVALKFFNNEGVSGEQDFTRIGDCIGFVSGVMQTASLRDASRGNRPASASVPRFCAPPDVSVEQVVRTAVKRLKSNPDELRADAAVTVLRVMSEGFPSAACIGSAGKQGVGLRWPDPPRKAHMRVRLIAVALAEPRSSFFSSHEVLIAETEIASEEWSLIKLVFAYLPYQPRLSESGFDYSVVHEVSAWRDPDCDETVADLTSRSLPDRHEPLIYSPHVPRVDLDRRYIPLPCYETKADDYIKSSLEPVGPPPEPSTPVLTVRSPVAAAPSGTADQTRQTPAPDGDKPVLRVRPKPTPE